MAPNHQTPALPPTDRLCLSVAEAAEQLRISPRGLYTLAERQGLPTIRLGGRRLIRRADLERWIAEQPVDRLGAEPTDKDRPPSPDRPDGPERNLHESG